MSPTQATLLFFAALLGGVVNSLAGGGGFVFFPALIFAGVPSISANITAKIVSWPGLIAGAWAYRRELVRQHEVEGSRGVLWALTATSALGGLAGAELVLWAGARAFDRMVPWLLLGSTAVFALGPLLLTRWRLRPAAMAAGHGLVAPAGGCGPMALAMHFVTGVYGGFYGGGVGVLILAVLGVLGMEEVQAMNALKMFLMVTLNILAVAVFIGHGAVAWPQATVMIVGSVLGGYGGAWCTRRLSAGTVRAIVTVGGTALTVYFFVRH